jgi:cytidylate kinase
MPPDEEVPTLLITISRQYLAGASAVAMQVAEALGWTVIDDAFIHAIAERLGYSDEDVRSLEERVPSFLERFAQSSAFSLPEVLLAAPESFDEPETIKLAHATRRFVEELGHRDRIVLVGRAAAAVLASEREALHVRLVASLDHRVAEAVARLGLDPAAAREAVEARDRARARYHRELYDRDWNDPVHYHMVLNTEALGLSGAAEVVIGRARALGW